MNRVRTSSHGTELAGRREQLRPNGFQITLTQQPCRGAVIE
jgi:hypothetical protein